MNQSELEALIRQSLDDFYQRRIKKLSELKLSAVLRKKNPYLLRAVGVQKASEIVEEVLKAYMSSSDETIFGDAFFEPIVRLCSGGRVSDSDGVDVIVETDTVYKAIAVKSGPNIFNSSQAKRQNDEFNSLRHRMHKIHKQFDPILGHCYGKTSDRPRKGHLTYRRLAGQALWEELTGDPDFYLKIIVLMSDSATQHRIEFEKEWANALKRFEDDFLTNFGKPDGTIDWENLLRFNSGKEKVAWISKVAPVAVSEVQDEDEDEDDSSDYKEE